MSTNINYGVKVNDLGLFMKEVAALRERLWNKYDQMETVKVFAEYVFNESRLYRLKKIDGTLEELYKSFKQEFLNDTSDSDFRRDQISINYYPDVELAMIYATNYKHADEIMEFKSVENYEYWNSTDQPSDISDTEWDERKEKWYEVTSAKDYSYELGYKGKLTIEVFNERPSATIYSKFKKHPSQYLEEYLKDSLKYNMIALHGTDEEKSEYEKVIKNRKYSQLSKFSDRQNELWDIHGENEMKLNLPIYEEILSTVL